MWQVTFSEEYGGRFKDFILASRALRYIKEHFHEGNYIDLENEKLGIKVRLKAPKEHEWTLGMKKK